MNRAFSCLRLLCAILIISVLGACSSVHLAEPQLCARPVELGATHDESSELHLITWNLHGTHQVAPMEERLGRVAAQVKARKPDVFLAQELWFRGDAAHLEYELLPDYRRVADYPQANGHLLSPFAGFRRGGLVAFVRDQGRWQEPDASDFVSFSKAAPWYKFDEGDGVSGKGFQFFTISAGPKHILVVNTHLQSQYLDHNVTYEAEREDQIRQIAEFVGRAAVVNAVVVAGDFNTTPDEKIWGSANGQWQDMTAPYRKACSCAREAPCVCVTDLPGKPEEGPAGWIDYVLVTSRGAEPSPRAILKTIKSDEIDCPYSDHHGLDLLLFGLTSRS